MRIRTNLTLPVGLLDTIPAGERSRVVVAALVQYLDLDPLTFEPKGTNPKPVEVPKPTPPFKSLPFSEQERIKDEFTAERNKTHPDQYCYGVVDTPAGYLPQYADMDPAE